MTRRILRMLLLGFLLSATAAFGHGLVQQPPSRNWFCGAITKPDHVLNRVAQYPVCGDAFAINFSAGYNFMSVLTHTEGRAVVGPRANVCGFNSESFGGGATVWDQPIDWPTNNLSAGTQTFTWNITWGPHFSDTQEFRYWITKPEFQFQVGRPLAWTDFEDQAFCTLTYSDANPTANPNVVADKAAAQFHTRCTVPPRQGRHVIYAEWGRNPFTFERFHGCIDAVFQGAGGGTPPPSGGTPPGGGTPLDAQITLSPNAAEFIGRGTLTLDGRSSTGANLSYQWSINSQNPVLYTLSNATQPVATLTLADPQAASNLTIMLTVSNPTGSDNATVNLVHRPSVASQWIDLGALTAEPRVLKEGDQVSVRTVLNSGQDVFYPASPFVVTAVTTAANAWPYALAQAVNQANGNIRIGVLNGQNEVVPAQDATANRTYALRDSNAVSGFLQVTAGGSGNVTSRVATINDWGSGYCANLIVTNQTLQPITWNVIETVQGKINNMWNATYTQVGTQLTARGVAWNAVLQPGQSTHSVGFCANR